jgi:hypothetical protein
MCYGRYIAVKVCACLKLLERILPGLIPFFHLGLDEGKISQGKVDPGMSESLAAAFGSMKD